MIPMSPSESVAENTSLHTCEALQVKEVRRTNSLLVFPAFT